MIDKKNLERNTYLERSLFLASSFIHGGLLVGIEGIITAEVRPTARVD